MNISDAPRGAIFKGMAYPGVASRDAGLTPGYLLVAPCGAALAPRKRRSLTGACAAALEGPPDYSPGQSRAAGAARGKPIKNKESPSGAIGNPRPMPSDFVGHSLSS